jgi:ATP-dependent Clp protease ATP-binding subunit ClpA
MFNRFTQDARRVAEEAPRVARDLGDSTVEAEHLLLAAALQDDAVARTLRAQGLDFDGIAAALVAETERSLAAVGVTADELTFSPFVAQPRFATSAKSALELSLRLALERGDRHIGTGHVVLAVLHAQHGTVPRALALAGVDRTALSVQVAAATGG